MGECEDCGERLDGAGVEGVEAVEEEESFVADLLAC